jgi:hypothetical protein
MHAYHLSRNRHQPVAALVPPLSGKSSLFAANNMGKLVESTDTGHLVRVVSAGGCHERRNLAQRREFQ